MLWNSLKGKAIKLVFQKNKNKNKTSKNKLKTKPSKMEIYKQMLAR